MRSSSPRSSHASGAAGEVSLDLGRTRNAVTRFAERQSIDNAGTRQGATRPGPVACNLIDDVIGDSA